MANSNGRIYTTLSGGTQYGVSVADVQTVLGTSKNDVGQLCTHDSINMWAKYRSIEKAGFKGILTDALRKSVNWGLGNIPIWTNKALPQAVKFWVGGQSSTGSTPPDCGIQTSYWTMVLPSTIYRLRDFASDVNDKGYFHGAQAPILPIVGSLAIPSTGQLDVIYPRGAENSETILLSDIGNFDDYYFGVVFAKDDFSTIYIMTQEYAIGSASWSQDFTLHIAGASSVLVPSGSSATWKVFPVLCSGSFATLTDVHASLAEYTTVALLEPTEEVITKAGVDYTLAANYARRDSNSRIVSYSFYFRNNETDTGLQGVRLSIRFKTAMGEVVASVQNTIGTVAANSNVNADGSYSFDSIGVAESIYSVDAHVDQIIGRDYTTQWAEAVVNAITPD